MKVEYGAWMVCAILGCGLIGCGDGNTAISTAPVSQVDASRASAEGDFNNEERLGAPISSAELALGDDTLGEVDSGLGGGFHSDPLTSSETDLVPDTLKPIPGGGSIELGVDAPDLSDEVGKLNPYE